MTIRKNKAFKIHRQFDYLVLLDYARTTEFIWTEDSFEKIQNAFFSRYQKILPWGNSNGSKTSPNFFLKKYLNKYGR